MGYEKERRLRVRGGGIEYQEGRGDCGHPDLRRGPRFHGEQWRMSMVSGTSKLQVGAILSAADAGGFAVPAFNYSDIWDFLAIVEAAEELDAPIFISSNQQVVTDIGIELTGAFGAAAIGKARIPLIHHLDHSNKVEICRAAVDNHYPSVMIDASARPLAENIAAVKQVVSYAHPHGVFMEGEVGRIQ